MRIKSKAFGEYQTNCYICELDGKSLIIDPGVGAVEWVLQNVTHPIAILNTHGHFDHVWSNKELKMLLNVPVVCHKEDAFLLEDDIFNMGLPACKPDILIDSEEIVEIEGIKFRFWHFPGHTPGCCMIEIEDALFSGDFIFKNSIGRYDFPYSSVVKMKESLQRFLNFDRNLPIYPGHGRDTNVENEQKMVLYWLEEM